MKRAVSVIIFLIALYFYVQVTVWLGKSTPLYVSIPIIWGSLSVGASYLWYRFRKNQPTIF
jgi:hypothetical protein